MYKLVNQDKLNSLSCKRTLHFYSSQNYQVGVGSRQIAALSRSQAASILNLTQDMVISDL